MNKILLFFNKHGRLLVVVFFAMLLIGGLSAYKDYGVGWDEKAQREIGLTNWDYALGHNQNLLEFRNRIYGPIFEVGLVGLEKAMSYYDHTDTAEVYQARHLATFLFFYLAVIVFYLLNKILFSSRWLGVLGSLCLILSPRILGDSFYNSKDIVLMSGFIIATYTMIQFLRRKKWSWLCLHALACAVVIDIRILGVLVPALTLFLWLIDSLKKDHRRAWKINAVKIFVYVMILGILTIIFWPLLWQSPINNFHYAFGAMKNFPWKNTVLYLGQYVEARDLPWHYAPVWLSITAPLPLLIFFSLGIFSIIAGLALKIKKTIFGDQYRRLIFAFWFFVPLFLVIYFNSTLYNGFRQMFFVYPAFIGLALEGVMLLKYISKKNTGKLARALMATIIILTIAYFGRVAYFIFEYHPHQNVYFNELAGDDPRSLWELDYWGMSYKQALEYLLAANPEGSIRIIAENSPGQYNLKVIEAEDRKRLIFVKRLDKADFFLTNFAYHEDDYPYQEVFSITADKSKIMAVYDLK